MDGLGTFGKSVLALFIAGIVFAWVFFVGFLAYGPEDESPIDALAEAATNVGIGSQPPIVAGGVEWTVDDLSWVQVGEVFRARVAVSPKADPSDRSFPKDALVALCNFIVTNKTGAPVGPARAVPPFRVDVILPELSREVPKQAHPFPVRNGVCSPAAGGAGLELPPPLAGWRSTPVFEVQLTYADIRFNYPALRFKGDLFRRHVVVGPNGAPPLSGELAGPPGEAHKKAACEILITETDFSPLGEVKGLTEVDRTIPKELAVSIGTSQNRIEGEPTTFRISGTQCLPKL